MIRAQNGAVWTDDMRLLYYYRNRLSGFGLSLLAESVSTKRGPGSSDAKGFLA